MSEKVIWEGTPSQKLNFFSYLFWLLPVFWLGLGLLVSLWKYLQIKTWKIKITNQRIIEEKGIFSKTINELELFRVKDIILKKSFWDRILGISQIYLRTSDKSNPHYILYGIIDGDQLRENLRNIVEKRREEKGVVERDFE